MHGCRPAQHGCHKGMPGLVIGHYLLVGVRQHLAFFLRSGHHCLHALFKVFCGDAVPSHAYGTQGAFVDDVRQFGP